MAPSHYGDKIRHGDKIRQTGAYNINIGKVSRLSGNPAPQLDLELLADELRRLRQELKIHAVEPEQDIQVAAIAEAEVAARRGDKASAVRHLAKVGEWAMAAATAIGTAVAAAAIKSAAGF